MSINCRFIIQVVVENTMLKTLYLRKKEHRRIVNGHHWVYSNEVDSKRSPLKSFSAGEQVYVNASDDTCLGVAVINPQTLICARLISRDKNQVLDQALIQTRIQQALELRQRCFTQPYYRLAYGDSDFLSGLVVDRFGDYLVVQISTAGMEVVKNEIIEALKSLLNPAGIYLKNDGKMRSVEGLESYSEVVHGEVPEHCEIIENDTKFLVPVKEGQKTGWFYDHRNARKELQRFVKDKTVLDVFSYVGGWGVQALAAGASELTCVDASEFALNYVQKNVELNDLSNKQKDKLHYLQGNAFEILKTLKSEGKTFDVIVLDPPALITKRKDHKQGLLAYQRANNLAVQLLNKNGLLVSASCSLHLKREELVQSISMAAAKNKREAQIIHHDHQGADHPIHPAIAETAYLKSVLAVIK